MNVECCINGDKWAYFQRRTKFSSSWDRENAKRKAGKQALGIPMSWEFMLRIIEDIFAFWKGKNSHKFQNLSITVSNTLNQYCWFLFNCQVELSLNLRTIFVHKSLCQIIFIWDPGTVN